MIALNWPISNCSNLAIQSDRLFNQPPNSSSSCPTHCDKSILASLSPNHTHHIHLHHHHQQFIRQFIIIIDRMNAKESVCSIIQEGKKF